MAKLTRQTLLQYGSSGATGDFGQFGSQAASAPVTTKDISTIQALTAWLDGLQDAVALGQAPYLQDMNGLFYVIFYMLVYAFQEGVPEYDSGSTYYTGSLVKKTGTSQLFASLGDNNTGNALPSAPASNAHWQFVSGMVSDLFAIGNGLAGTTTNDSAPAGAVGQRVNSAVGLSSVPTSNQWGDLASISLTAGDWDVDVLTDWAANGATVSNVSVGVSTHSGNDSTGLTIGDTFAEALPPTSGANSAVAVPKVQMSLSGTATVYLKIKGAYSVATPQCAGRITARRVR